MTSDWQIQLNLQVKNNTPNLPEKPGFLPQFSVVW